MMGQLPAAEIDRSTAGLLRPKRRDKKYVTLWNDCDFYKG